MTQTKTMIQTEAIFDSVSYFLAQDQDVADLRRRIEDAVGTSGSFVHLVVVGNRQVSVLVTPHSRVTISVSTVAFDERDTGDTEYPYGGYYDMI
ncbi:hypothetical protein [uncultured Microbacterium sp.]|uniref:hypothetical protein n=1 Tax=uncultured Microbacterium sp. TaxID=191216 RepID=UPI0028D6C5C2|nr:hypothetical protein [uncultured Microbacterium sp.]